MDFVYGNFECNGGVADELLTGTKVQNIQKRKTVNLELFLKAKYGDKIFKDIRYIKIDTEGHDYTILNSFHSLLNHMIKFKYFLPVIQVEYFAYFRYNNEKDGKLKGGSVKLFSAIANLPVKYSIYCSAQCNNEMSCDTNLKDELYIETIDGPKNMDNNNKHLIATYLRFKNNKLSAVCDDVLLIPEKKYLTTI
jgi:hypothetical protein